MNDSTFVALYGALCVLCCIGIVQTVVLLKIHRLLSRTSLKNVVDSTKSAASEERNNYNSLIRRMSELQNKTYAGSVRSEMRKNRSNKE